MNAKNKMKKEFTQTAICKMREGVVELGVFFLQKFYPLMIVTASEDDCENGKCSCSFHGGDKIRIRETRSGGFEYLSGNMWKMIPRGMDESIMSIANQAGALSMELSQIIHLQDLALEEFKANPTTENLEKVKAFSKQLDDWQVHSKALLEQAKNRLKS